MINPQKNLPAFTTVLGVKVYHADRVVQFSFEHYCVTPVLFPGVSVRKPDDDNPSTDMEALGTAECSTSHIVGELDWLIYQTNGDIVVMSNYEFQKTLHPHLAF